MTEIPEAFKPRHMMATVAIHKFVDTSYRQPNLCVVIGEEGEFWIGRWKNDCSCINLRFPKATTRELNVYEVAVFKGLVVRIRNNPDAETDIR